MMMDTVERRPVAKVIVNILLEILKKINLCFRDRNIV
jgi:hypothetical protein